MLVAPGSSGETRPRSPEVTSFVGGGGDGEANFIISTQDKLSGQWRVTCCCVSAVTFDTNSQCEGEAPLVVVVIVVVVVVDQF